MADPLLKLAAEDADDLQAISALVQDAVLTVGDLAFLPKVRRFAAVLNRYRWEAGDRRGRGERIRAGLRFDGVTAAQATRLKQDARDIVLELLAVTFASDPPPPGPDPDAPTQGGTVTLTFAGGAAIKLKVEALDAHLDDLTGPWPAKARPDHGAA